MSTSKFCIQQRLQEKQKLQRFLLFGFTGSALLHGILAYTFPSWSFESPNKTEKPIELIIVDQPKPKVESEPVVKPEPPPIPKPEPVKAVNPPPPVKQPEPVKAVNPPPPVKQPEPVKAVNPPPPVKQPEPVKPPITPPKPSPQKVLTSPTPAPSQPVASAPIEDTTQPPSLSNSFNNSSSLVSASADTSSSSIGVPGAVAVGSSAPPRPQSSNREGITCVSNCQPEYPAALEGVEGNAQIKLTIDSNGNVTSATVATANSNSQINRQALLAARKMKFSSPPGNVRASVQVKINFTVAGSEYDRTARQEQTEREQAEKERQEQEAARQRQLEQERQARQEKLEREREARTRIEQQQREQAESQQQQPLPTPQAVPKPLPDLLETEVDDEILRKFRERIEQHQQE